MVVEIIGLAVALIGSIMVSSAVSNRIGADGWKQVFVETTFMGVGAWVVAELWWLSPEGILVIMGTTFIIGMIGVGYERYQHRKLMNGGYGDEAKWAIELRQEGDDHFIIAMNALTQTELKEVGIIAESKQELRDLTIERFEEKEDGQIPQEFMQ